MQTPYVWSQLRGYEFAAKEATIVRVRRGGVVVAIFAALVFAPAASAADNWLPHPSDATWTYQWTDSVYATTPTKEKVTVKSTTGTSFTLAWTTDGLDNPDAAVSTAGTISFQETNNGLVNTDWSSTPPPSDWPILCASAANCGNALSSTYYNVIWGSRDPVLDEPLVRGLSWSSFGGAAQDVAGQSTYLGQSQVSVPAFPKPVTAAVVRTVITQAGALGDPYGSGTRTIWWVYGVGPVKIQFQHAGGNQPLTESTLQSTNQQPQPTPTDIDYFPFNKGQTLTYRWTNTKHLKKPELEQFTVDAVANGSARFTVKNLSGPIKLAGSYGFSKRLDGVTNLWGNTASATLLKLPPLGPSFASPKNRRHIVTPFDLMTWGFNPVIPAYPATGDTWSAHSGSVDFTTYGVTGSARVMGLQKVKVPAGTFLALPVVSTLTEKGFPYGSGTRTSWFAPGKGLVKLVFRHGDGSLSTVELVK
jgi:hypothetical protein